MEKLNLVFSDQLSISTLFRGTDPYIVLKYIKMHLHAYMCSCIWATIWVDCGAGSQAHSMYACPRSIHWSDDALERDLYIETTTVTVLAMDGRRRWLDIEKLVSFLLSFIKSSRCSYLS